ncbi:MAG: IclR family transcriptional regulator [Chloroflexi bacterium]|nr:IclR family transcriptional regulator [Chloroflexota bacterium]
METDLVPAVDRTARILLAFKSGKEELGVSELSKSLGINKSTVHKIMLTLCHHGFLERSESSKRYRLGHALFDLGNVMLDGIDLRAIARPYLKSLVTATGQTVLLGILDGDRVIIVDREESPEPMKVTSPIGYRIPACAGSFGMVLLSEDDVDRLFGPAGLPSFTRKSINNLDAYKRELAKAHQQGYAVDDEEYLEGVRAVSAPVIGHGRTVIAAVTVVGFAAKMPDDRIPFIIQQTVRACAQISLRMGGNPGT